MTKFIEPGEGWELLPTNMPFDPDKTPEYIIACTDGNFVKRWIPGPVKSTLLFPIDNWTVISAQFKADFLSRRICILHPDGVWRSPYGKVVNTDDIVGYSVENYSNGWVK